MGKMGDFVGKVGDWTRCCLLDPWLMGPEEWICHLDLTAVDKIV